MLIYILNNSFGIFIFLNIDKGIFKPIATFSISTFKEKVEVGNCYWEVASAQNREIRLAIISIHQYQS